MSALPRAVASGAIFGGVDCYVFADGSTALSQRGMLRGLRGKDGTKGGAEDGDLGRYLARLPEKYSGLAAAPIPFLTPDGTEALGRASRDFVAMCRAYAEMYADGSIHRARIPIARNCIAILAGLADVGIDELVYRASNWHPVPVVQPAPAFDLGAVGDLVRAVVSESMRSIGDGFRAELATMRRETAVYGGAISGMQADDMKRAIKYVAMAMRDLDDHDTVDSARKAVQQMLGGMVGWNGTGRQLHLMSANRYVEAMGMLRSLKKQLDRRLKRAKKPFPNVNDPQTEMFPASPKPRHLQVVGNSNGKKGVA